MRKPLALSLSAAAAAALCLGTAGPALAGTAPADGPDAQFLVSNTQTDLAEITLARIVLARTDDPTARDLARVTKHDHQVALGKARTVARHAGVTLPDQPNAMQQAAAAELESSTDVPKDYFTVQIAGHEESIAGTQAEIANGTRSAVVTYATGYLPVAQMHLQMAQQDLAAISG